MPMNTVQYPRGLSMMEVFQDSTTQDRFEELVQGWRWPAGFACPHCQCA